ncbi:MAG TPA: phosphoribosyltransferase family protein, partial [Acidimicrobiia bacterium]
MFRDRRDAGARLAERLEHLRAESPVVLGLPRGGVPVAYEVATRLGAPLDVIVVRKLGVPFQPELGMGAVGEDGVIVLNDDVLRLARVRDDELARIEARERQEVERRARRFRGGRPRVDVTQRTAVIVDDGIATGGSARAALRVARAQGARRVVLAVPVGSPDTVAEMRQEADEVVCVETPFGFLA